MRKMRSSLVLIATVLLLFLFDNALADCGYSSCPTPNPDMLNVHIVAHTHDDVGWLKTVDQYYYGGRPSIQRAGVQYIITSIVKELLRDPEKRFIYVESAFFSNWWYRQNERVQNDVRMLIEEGRLEFIGGAWSMNDEAGTYYNSIVDQFTLGLKFLNDTFGECGRPRVGWQIDPFGLSREMASLFTQMDYDGLFVCRIDYQDKINRLSNRNAEFIWHTNPNLGSAADLFTGVLYNNYAPPPGFCFDVTCFDDPMIDNPNIPDYNVDEKLEAFFAYVNRQSEQYRSNNIILTMGEDFHYQAAHMWFKNLDKLIKYANEKQATGSRVNVFYSTPSCYLKSLLDSNIDWPSKTDDFMPYASDPHAYWTGYYTSRPTQKRFEREGANLLQISKQLLVSAPQKTAEHEPNLAVLRQTMGIMQHHDAITGTAKQHVADDYARLLTEAVEAGDRNANDIINQLSQTNTLNIISCLNLNTSQCRVTEDNQQFTVTLYNSLSRFAYQIVRLPVPLGQYEIFNDEGFLLPIQILPVPDSVLALNVEHRNSTVTDEIAFFTDAIPPLGYRSFYIRQTSLSQIPPERPTVVSPDEIVTISNDLIQLTFEDGLLSLITIDNVSHRLEQNFWFYEGAVGNNREYLNRSSGAYIFRPNSTIATVSNTVELSVVRGPIVEEVHQKFNEWVSQVVRLYRRESYVEFEWTVGGIPFEDGIGREIVTRYDSDIASDSVFYTDANGRQTIRRIRNHRDSWNVDLQEPVAGNYFPVTAKIAIEDNTNRMAVITDRTQGGSSLQDGSIELMVHRRLLYDDAFGVGEALNETEFGSGMVARGKHYLVFGSSQTTTSPTLFVRERDAQIKKTFWSWRFLSPASFSLNQWQLQLRNTYSAISQTLPDNVNILTLELWRENSVLVRFEHIFELFEDPVLSNPVTINIETLFQAFTITGIRETTLGANKWLEESDQENSFDITLSAMQIRTFILDVQWT